MNNESNTLLNNLLEKISDAGRVLDALSSAARVAGEYDLAKEVLRYQGKLIDAARDVTQKLRPTEVTLEVPELRIAEALEPEAPTLAPERSERLGKEKAHAR